MSWDPPNISQLPYVETVSDGPAPFLTLPQALTLFRAFVSSLLFLISLFCLSPTSGRVELQCLCPDPASEVSGLNSLQGTGLTALLWTQSMTMLPDARSCRERCPPWPSPGTPRRPE